MLKFVHSPFCACAFYFQCIIVEYLGFTWWFHKVVKRGKTSPNGTEKQLIPEFQLSILLIDSNEVCLHALNTSTNTVKHSSLQKLGSSPQFHFHNEKRTVQIRRDSSGDVHSSTHLVFEYASFEKQVTVLRLAAWMINHKSLHKGYPIQNSTTWIQLS